MPDTLSRRPRVSTAGPGIAERPKRDRACSPRSSSVRRKATVPGIALVAMLIAAGIFTATSTRPRPTRPHRPVAAPSTGDLARAAAHFVKPTRDTVPTLDTTPTSGGSSTLSESGPGSLPQTDRFPVSDSPAFRNEMRALWQGIRSDSLPAALPSFFPEAAYLQVKKLPAPRTDYLNRLLVEFQLDVGAAHRLLGANASSAKLIQVSVPADQARWVSPGDCLNKIGYFQVSGSRLSYSVRGQVRSFVIASLISWRGVWYVVHLGAISRRSERGVVDDPTLGPGTFGPPEGC